MYIENVFIPLVLNVPLSDLPTLENIFEYYPGFMYKYIYT